MLVSYLHYFQYLKKINCSCVYSVIKQFVSLILYYNIIIFSTSK